MVIRPNYLKNFSHFLSHKNRSNTFVKYLNCSLRYSNVPEQKCEFNYVHAKTITTSSSVLPLRRLRNLRRKLPVTRNPCIKCGKPIISIKYYESTEITSRT